MSEVKNAIIVGAKINDADRGFLTAWLELDYGNSNQGFATRPGSNPSSAVTAIEKLIAKHTTTESVDD